MTPNKEDIKMSQVTRKELDCKVYLIEGESKKVGFEGRKYYALDLEFTDSRLNERIFKKPREVIAYDLHIKKGGN